MPTCRFTVVFAAFISRLRLCVSEFSYSIVSCAFDCILFEYSWKWFT